MSIPYWGREIFCGPTFLEMPRKVCREKTTRVVLSRAWTGSDEERQGKKNSNIKRPNRQNRIRSLFFKGRMVFVRLATILYSNWGSPVQAFQSLETFIDGLCQIFRPPVLHP